LKNNSLKLEDIGLTEMPEPGQVLEKTIFDVSTKLETTDRYISWQEAKEICNLTDDELDNLKNITKRVADLITEETKKIGLVNEDGKIEFGFNENREPIIVDALGTLDECRFTYNGKPVSKEIARIYYRDTEWHKEVEQAKKQDKINWKSLVKSRPEPLPPEFAESISAVYKAYVNEITGKKWFDVPSINEILDKM